REPLSYLGHRPRAGLPEDAHHIELAVREAWIGHGALPVYGSTRRLIGARSPVNGVSRRRGTTRGWTPCLVRARDPAPPGLPSGAASLPSRRASPRSTAGGRVRGVLGRRSEPLPDCPHP